MSHNEREWTRPRRREWGNGDIILILAAMVVVMAIIAVTLHRNSPFTASGPGISTSEPSTTGQGGFGPVRGRNGIER
jgi:hypothetical protein